MKQQVGFMRFPPHLNRKYIIRGSYVAAYIVLAVVAVIGFILVATLDDRCIGREDA